MAFVQERFKGLVAEYGPLLFAVYFSIFGLVFVGSALLGKPQLEKLMEWAQRTLGVNLGGAAATAGAWTLAYLFTKAMQPLRIAATIALTPLVASIWHRLRRVPAGASVVEPQRVVESADAPKSDSGRQS